MNPTHRYIPNRIEGFIVLRKKKKDHFYIIRNMIKQLLVLGCDKRMFTRIKCQ